MSTQNMRDFTAHTEAHSRYALKSNTTQGLIPQNTARGAQNPARIYGQNCTTKISPQEEIVFTFHTG